MEEELGRFTKDQGGGNGQRGAVYFKLIDGQRIDAFLLLPKITPFCAGEVSTVLDLITLVASRP